MSEHGGRGLQLPSSTLFAWLVIGATALLIAFLLLDGIEGAPSISALLFWIGLLAAVELLPVYLGFATELTMGFVIILPLVILFPPEIAMIIVGIGSFDPRELARRIPVHKALFNRAQSVLAVAGACVPFIIWGRGSFEALPIVLAAVVHLVINLGLVTLAVSAERRVAAVEVVRELLPPPLGGFLLSYATLVALGVVAALLYQRIDYGEWAVAAILIPLMFARMSIIAARKQSEMSEEIRRQQSALLDASEKIFQEREDERGRIAEDIHDASLQSLAAASYAAGNALEMLATGDLVGTRQAISSAHQAVDDSMHTLRHALADLRRSSIGDEGLVPSVRRFADQIETLWPAKVKVEGQVRKEPPTTVALAALQIVQEAVTNALKHSGSDRVEVLVTENETGIHIVVEDHGQGFAKDRAGATDHLGLSLMRERAARAGGTLSVESAETRGTRVEAILPGAVG